MCVCVCVCLGNKCRHVAGLNIFSLYCPATAICHHNSSPHRKACSLFPLNLLCLQGLESPCRASLQCNTLRRTHAHTNGRYKVPIHISYVPVWISLGNTLTNEGDMVKVFMLCNPTVYLLVIQGSERKHILCLISHLLSGWIHSVRKMPYGDNKGIRGRVSVCIPTGVYRGNSTYLWWQFKGKTIYSKLP